MGMSRLMHLYMMRRLAHLSYLGLSLSHAPDSPCRRPFHPHTSPPHLYSLSPLKNTSLSRDHGRLVSSRTAPLASACYRPRRSPYRRVRCTSIETTQRASFPFTLQLIKLSQCIRQGSKQRSQTRWCVGLRDVGKSDVEVILQTGRPFHLTIHI